MGTPDFAEGVLDYIFQKGWNVVGVVTTPDKPSGRGLQLNESEVKKFAVKHQIPLLQPIKLKDDDFLNALSSWQADVFVVVAFRMLPKEVWTMPEKGTFNLHASLLPQYRGAAPIHWAIVNGETETGVTTFFIDEKIDTGDIIAQRSIKIDNDDTLGSLYPKLMKLGSQLVDETLTLIDKNQVKTYKQPSAIEKISFAPKFTKENTQITWNQTAKDICNFVRGFNPFPVAWTILKNGDDVLNVKIFEVEIDKQFNKKLNPGGICIENGLMYVGTNDDVIKINTIQVPDKRKMDTKSLLNGFKMCENAVFIDKAIN